MEAIEKNDAGALVPHAVVSDSTVLLGDDCSGDLGIFPLLSPTNKAPTVKVNAPTAKVNAPTAAPVKA